MKWSRKELAMNVWKNARKVINSSQGQFMLIPMKKSFVRDKNLKWYACKWPTLSKSKNNSFNRWSKKWKQKRQSSRNRSTFSTWSYEKWNKSEILKKKNTLSRKAVLRPMSKIWKDWPIKLLRWSCSRSRKALSTLSSVDSSQLKGLTHKNLRRKCWDMCKIS